MLSKKGCRYSAQALNRANVRILYICRLLFPTTLNVVSTRERRQAVLSNLRTNWITTTYVIISWDPPPSGSLQEYELVYSAIIVSNGQVGLTHRLTRATATQTSIVIQEGVSRGNINIFFLAALFIDSTFDTELFIEGNLYSYYIIC